MPTLLVLDANADAPMQMRRLTEGMNAVVFEASHLEFALELLRRGTIGVVVVGERLLGRHGPIETVRAIRERHPQVRIVFRASAEAADLRSSVLAAGADDALPDTDPDGLVAAIGKSLRAA